MNKVQQITIVQSVSSSATSQLAPLEEKYIVLIQLTEMPLKVLSALDSARTQYYHFKAIIIAGMGLFTDAYDLFCIIPVMKLIGRIYYSEPDSVPPKLGSVPPSEVSVAIAIALCGTVFGQVVFGYLGDKIGRKRVYGIALLIMICSSIGSGFSICRTKKCVLTSLCFFRFWLGFGIGGDYPISATIMSEFANKMTRGSFIAAVFSMQGFGILTGSFVTMILCTIFDNFSKASKINVPSYTPDEADLVWRLILIFGAVPAAMTYYWRMSMPETARYTALVQKNHRQAALDMEKVLDVSIMHQFTEEPDVQPPPPAYDRMMSKEFFRRHGCDLFACSSAWLLVDIVFYSSNLFQSQIYSHHLRDPHRVNAYQEAYDVAKFQALIAVSSTVPGYWATVIFIDRIGRVKIQLMGFLAMGVCLLAVGIPYSMYWAEHTNAGFLILYGLTFFFSNFGPNTTTFIVPAELFPTRFRSTCHGISGAAGKVGAIVGSVGFQWASEEGSGDNGRIGTTIVLVALGGVCFLGAILTYFFTTETNGRSLEENET